MISPENIRSLFDCDPKAGILTWRVASTNKIKIGDRAGTPASNGYRAVRYLNKYYGEHRIIWLWVHGRWPDKEVDHINGNRSDNRIANLRDATPNQNRWNSRSKKASGLKGAHYNKNTGLWQSQILRYGKNHYLGSHPTEEAAHAAYVSAAARLHGEYARFQ